MAHCRTKEFRWQRNGRVLNVPNLEIESREACTGIIEVSSRAEAFASYIQSETKKWAKVIRDAKITDE